MSESSVVFSRESYTPSCDEMDVRADMHLRELSIFILPEEHQSSMYSMYKYVETVKSYLHPNAIESQDGQDMKIMEMKRMQLEEQLNISKYQTEYYRRRLYDAECDSNNYYATSKDWEYRYNNVTRALENAQLEIIHWKERLDSLDQERMRVQRELDYSSFLVRELNQTNYFMEINMKNMKKKMETVEQALIVKQGNVWKMAEKNEEKEENHEKPIEESIEWKMKKNDALLESAIEKLKQSENRFERFLDQLHNNVKCMICLGMVDDHSVITDCGHGMCGGCHTAIPGDDPDHPEDKSRFPCPQCRREIGWCKRDYLLNAVTRLINETIEDMRNMRG